jgi:hypothetical protein
MTTKSDFYNPPFKKLAVVSLFLWLLISIYGSAGFIVVFSDAYPNYDGNTSLAFFRFFGINLLLNLPWLFIVPAIIYLAKLYPINQRPFFTNSLYHILSLLFVIVISAIYKLSSIKILNPEVTIELITFFRTTLLYIDAEILLYTVTLAGYYVIDYYYKQENETIKKNLLLSTLNREQLNGFRSHIQPLFLDNTLQDIERFIHSKPKLAEKMLADLAHLLRQLLINTEKNTLNFESELKVLKLYIQILSDRIGNRIAIHTEHLNYDSVDSIPFSHYIITALEGYYRTDVEILKSLQTLSFSSENGSSLKISFQDINPKNNYISNDINRNSQLILLNDSESNLKNFKEHQVDFNVSSFKTLVISINKREVSAK